MSDREWEKFFELLSKFVNQGKAVPEKEAELKAQVKANAAETDLGEFVSYAQEAVE